MHHLIIVSFILMITLSVQAQSEPPDLAKKEDLRALGWGRIIEKDNSIIKKIMLSEVKEYWIVYVKNESLHDFMMEKTDRIEFPDSKWGRLIIKFPNNKPEISWIKH